MQKSGLFPNMVVVRSKNIIKDDSILKKLALFSGTHLDNIITIPDINNQFNVPLYIYQQNITQKIFNVTFVLFNY